VSESEAVLVHAMEFFGWSAGLKYLDRLAENAHSKYGPRHTNMTHILMIQIY
jgi:hypothetical protein